MVHGTFKKYLNVISQDIVSLISKTQIDIRLHCCEKQFSLMLSLLFSGHNFSW